MTVRAVAEYKGNFSENVEFGYGLKKSDIGYSLAENWNWISHNVENAVSVSEFAGDGVSRILSQTEEVVRDPKYGLVGNLSELNPLEAYKVCVSDASWTGRISGVSFDPATPVKLCKGWNWIGCPTDDSSLLINDLLANAGAEEGDMLVGLDGFEQVDADGSWKGTLSSMSPGAGYMYFSNSEKEFVYNIVPAKETTLPTRSANMSPWVADNHRYPSVMPVTAVVDGMKDALAESGAYHVGAFCGDECRGVGMYVDGVVMINVHGNPGDKIAFRMMSAAGKRSDSVVSVDFEEYPLGSLSEPYEIGFSGSVSVEGVSDSGYDVVVENGVLTVKGDLSGVASVEVYDLSGIRVAASSSVEDGVLTFGALQPGAVVVVIRTDNTCVYRRIMVDEYSSGPFVF